MRRKWALAYLEAFQGPLCAEGAEELHKLLGVDGMRVDDDALDVRQVCVVLQGAHVQTGLLTQLSNPAALAFPVRPLQGDIWGRLTGPTSPPTQKRTGTHGDEACGMRPMSSHMRYGGSKIYLGRS